MSEPQQFIPGMRVQIRDAEWRIDRVDVPTHGGMLLTCTGHSELVRGRPAKFLTDLENDVQILAPETTNLVDDLSDGYAATQLYIETVLRTTPPSDQKIHIGHLAAMDLLPYQLDPALQALKQSRPRILIADAVGLGKTIGSGVLVSELIRRERGKRILVLVVKSMLMQFQREFWQRFTIPLVRLDSVGLQRIRNNIPTNNNPFHYFDRAIISIDTLKQNLEYKQYLEQSYWDIVVIDEAHNVARRSTNSLRHQLAQLLSTRCDAMIMLSATPHDGKPESFASLMNMLDPTALPNPKDYSQDDFKDKGLVIRRFKSDVADQLAQTLPDRVVHKCFAQVSTLEDQAFDLIRSAKFRTLNRGSAGAGHLFRTTLEKALLSSPAACLSTASKRLAKLDKKEASEDIQHDKAILKALCQLLQTISKNDFAKFQLLVAILGNNSKETIGWNRKDANDRVVIFTESVQSLNFLTENLPKNLKLKTGQVASIHGQDRDVDIVKVINEFTNPSSKLRVLLCSDVASEGLNLHHCSHRLIHFDIPWSLMVFQQRNGRIDRYGQSIQPQIYYLASECSNPAARDDHRVLEILIEKDTQASKNLGDPSEFMGGASVDEQEQMTAEAMESGKGAEQFAQLLESFLSNANEDLAGFDADTRPTQHSDLPNVIGDRPRIYESAREFATAALGWLQTQRGTIKWSHSDGIVDLKAPADLQYLAKRLPREAIPEDFRFLLCDDVARIQEDMKKARDDETDTFGKLQYLWPQHPVIGWLMQTVTDAFGRHTAPVMRLPHKLARREHWVLAQGGFPNKRGQALIQSHLAVRFQNDAIVELLSFGDAIARLGLNGKSLPNRAESADCEALSLYLPDAVTHLRQHLQAQRLAHHAEFDERLKRELVELQSLKEKHVGQLELALEQSAMPAGRKQTERRRRLDEITRKFEDFEQWIANTWQTEEEPYIQIVAVVTGDSAKDSA